MTSDGRNRVSFRLRTTIETPGLGKKKERNGTLKRNTAGKYGVNWERLQLVSAGISNQ